jgi:NitT/TauT family transport system ATP-binding protein
MVYEEKETILKIENLSLTLNGNQILRDINLHVEDVIRPGVSQGQVIALLGPSGIGKTQLIRSLSGLYCTDMNTKDKTTFNLQGSVKIGIELEPVALGKVGVVQQNYPLFEHRTVLSNLSFHNKKVSNADAKVKAEEYLNLFGLWEHRDKYPAQLSGGQRQRVAIVQQLLSSDHFILLDEPFSGLDINMIAKVSDTICKISCLDELNTVIIVSHDIAATCAISDTVWMLGKDKNPDGTFVPGAYIKHEYDLMAAGLAWDPGIREMPRFSSFTREVRAKFKDLG